MDRWICDQHFLQKLGLNVAMDYAMGHTIYNYIRARQNGQFQGDQAPTTDVLRDRGRSRVIKPMYRDTTGPISSGKKISGEVLPGIMKEEITSPFAK
jgi:hypothetical protein